MSTARDFEDNGWDVRARLVDGSWVERAPRRREVAGPLRREVDLLGWLAPQLPLAIPRPELVSDEPLRLRHPLIPGRPSPGTSAQQGEQLGAFLSALHSVPVRAALEHGVPPAHETAAERQRLRNDFASMVVPRLPADLKPDALRLLVRMTQADFAVALTHSDVGPDHVRVIGDEVTGVIDWTDASLGDPAIDLAWGLYGASPKFAAGLRTAYPVDDRTAARALDWHLLGPWHEVHFGLRFEAPEYVVSGLEGASARLRAAR